MTLPNFDLNNNLKCKGHILDAVMRSSTLRQGQGLSQGGSRHQLVAKVETLS
jgi:hypothetical protein